MKLVLEIRAGEGGDDAKTLIRDQADIYAAYAVQAGLKCSVEQTGSV